MNPDDKFDLSDDRLDDVLAIAAEVVGEYAPDHGHSRIERMARFLIGNLGDPTELIDHEPGWVRFENEWVTPAEARALASALLRAAALASE